MAAAKHTKKGKSGLFVKSGKPVKRSPKPAFLKKKLGK